MSQQSERGAAAVEFAIVLPVLLILVLGIAEFGRAYNTQISLTHAAREGVRVMAISNNPLDAETTVKNAAASLNPAVTNEDIAITTTSDTSTSCMPGAVATVTITYTLDTLTGIAGPFTMTGKGVMRCGG